MRRPTKAELIFYVCFGTWLTWIVGGVFYSKWTYVFDGFFYKLIITTVASLIGLFVAWRHFMRGKSVGEKNTVLFATFFLVTGFVMGTFWNVPEIVMITTAHKHVSDEYKFKIVHPGPSKGRGGNCKAGIVYYDSFLKRNIEFCSDNESQFFYTDTLMVEKLVSERGGKILRFEAVH